MPLSSACGTCALQTESEIQGQGQDEEAFNYEAQNMRTNARENSTYVVKIQQTVVSNSMWKTGLGRREKDTACKQQQQQQFVPNCSPSFHEQPHW